MKTLTEFEIECLDALSHLDCSKEIKMEVICPSSKEVGYFESIGGNREIYYKIKDIVSPIAVKHLNTPRR